MLLPRRIVTASPDASPRTRSASYLTTRVAAAFPSGVATCAATSVGAIAALPSFTGTAPTTIATAKTTSGTTCPPTYINAGATVTGVAGVVSGIVLGGFYMQDSAAANGIFVKSSTSVSVDQAVTVAGTLTVTGGQLQLVASSVTLGAATLATALTTLVPSTFSSGACAGMQYEGIVVSMTSVALSAATASAGNQLGYLSSASGMLVVGTATYMQSFQGGQTFATLRGVMVGTPAMNNQYLALNPRGLADLGTFTTTVTAGSPCAVNGMCSGLTGGAASQTFTPVTIYNADFRPMTSLSTSVIGTGLAPIGSATGSANNYVSLSALAALGASPDTLVGTGTGTGYQLPLVISSACPSANASMYSTATYAPLLGQQVYIEGIYTAPLPVTTLFPITDFSYCTNSDATCTDAPASMFYATGTTAATSTSQQSCTSVAGTTPSGTWCVQCSYPSGYYISTTEVSGPFSGIFVNLYQTQIQYLDTGSLYPMTTLCPNFAGASLLPHFPTPTTSMRLGITGTLQMDSDGASGVILNNVQYTVLQESGVAPVQPVALSTRAFAYSWPTQVNTTTGVTMVKSPGTTGVSTTGACPASNNGGTTPMISHPSFMPYKGALVSFSNVTILSYIASVNVDNAAKTGSGYYVVTDSSGNNVYPIIVAATIYASWKPVAITGLTLPSLFQCGIIAPLIGIVDWNPSMNAWVVMPRSSSDISSGGSYIPLNNNCVPACASAVRQITFGSTAVALPGPTVSASCTFS